MPLIEVTLGGGRSPEQVRDLMHEVHRAVQRSVGAAPQHIRVIVREVPREHWATGDVTLSEMDTTAAAGGGV
jgi:4-oxalocrotonate tautomerase